MFIITARSSSEELSSSEQKTKSEAEENPSPKDKDKDEGNKVNSTLINKPMP